MRGSPGGASGTIPVELRPERASDARFLRELYASTRWEELRPVPWTDDEKLAFLAMQFDAQRAHYSAAYEGASFDVVLAQDGRAGRLYVSRTVSGIRIVDISLLPSRRGQGIGTRLVRDLIDESERMGLPLSVHVEQTNPALRWYERLGFAAIHLTPPYVYMERPPSATQAR